MVNHAACHCTPTSLSILILSVVIFGSRFRAQLEGKQGGECMSRILEKDGHVVIVGHDKCRCWSSALTLMYLDNEKHHGNQSIYHRGYSSPAHATSNLACAFSASHTHLPVYTTPLITITRNLDPSRIIIPRAWSSVNGR